MIIFILIHLYRLTTQLILHYMTNTCRFLALIISLASLWSLTSCSEENGNEGKGNVDNDNNKTTVITVDGEKYICENSYDNSALQSKQTRRIYTEFYASNETKSCHIWLDIVKCSRVADLDIGEELTTDTDVMLREYNGSDDWDEIEGCILIKDIQENMLTIQYKDFIIEKEDKRHTINGTVILYNSVVSGDTWEPLPFSETESI